MIGIGLGLYVARQPKLREGTRVKESPIAIAPGATLPPPIATNGFEPIIAAQIEEALGEVRAAPRSARAWGKLGLVLQAYDLLNEARSCFVQAETFDPAEARWPYFHALLLSQVNNGAALAELEKAVKLGGNRFDAPRLALAQFLLATGRSDDAEREYKKLVQANAHHVPALLGLAGLNHARGQVQAVRQLLSSCLTNAHTARRAHTLLGQVERQLGNITAAEGAIRTAALFSPDLPWPDPFTTEAAQYRIGRKAWTDQAQQRLDQNRPGDAQPLITRLVKDYPHAPQGWLLLSRLRLGQNDCVGAEQALRRHLQLAPESVNGQSQLGVALLCLERYPEAIPFLQAAVQLKPDFAEAHFNLGFAQARAGHGDEAIQSFRNAIRYGPNLVTPYITLADLLHQTGEKTEAMDLLHRALQLSPSDERAKALLERLQP